MSSSARLHTIELLGFGVALRALLSVAAASFLFVYASSSRAQERATTTEHQGQSWIGYMTQARFADDYSWWNDAHFVPGAFYVLRTGLTYHLTPQIAATGGYAYLGLPIGALTPDLKRREHRPWGQIVSSQRLDESWNLVNRLRYDARFRRNLRDGELAPGYGFTNRIRYFLSFRRDIPELTFGARIVPYVTLGNELLMDAGPQSFRMDQNRTLVGFGVTRNRIALQASYMNRFVQLASAGPDRAFVMNHTLVLWIFHTFDLRRGARPLPEAETSL